jgi:hypothetical protein
MGEIYTIPRGRRPRMRRIVWLAVVGLGCQRSAPDENAPPPPTVPAADRAAYAKDIAQVCDVVTLSGADTLEGDARILPIAQYLGSHIQTQQAREFLARIQPLVGAAKADALDAEAKKAGLASCALAAEWRKPRL